MNVLKIEYNDFADRDRLLRENTNKYLIKEINTIEGNFLVFSTTKPFEIEFDELIEDVNNVAELTTIVAMDKDELAEMLVYALQKIDELEGRLNG